MPNIFQGLDILDNNVIRDNIAMLEATTMESVIKGYGTSVANKSASLVNGISNFLGKESKLKVVEEKRIEDYIEDKKYELRNLNRSQLDSKLRVVLKEKLKLVCDSSDDLISASVINSVAKNMNIHNDMTVAQKADAIREIYFKKMLDIIEKELKKQNREEADKTIAELEKSIKILSQNDKEELKKVLNVEKLTGQEIRAVLMKAGMPTLILGALSASGFGAFMALTTIMHAVFTTILGITVPFAVYTSATSALSLVLGPVGVAFVAGTAVWQFAKGNKKLKNEILGQMAFIAVTSYGGSFVAKDEDLPSHESDPKLIEEINEKDKEYRKLVKDNAILQKNISYLKDQYNKLNKDIVNYKNIINQENIKREQSKSKIIELKLEKDEVKNSLNRLARDIELLEKEKLSRNDEEFNGKLGELKKQNINLQEKQSSLNLDIKYQDEIITNASKEIDYKNALIKGTEIKNLQLQKENDQLKIEILDKDKKIEKTEGTRKKEILDRWSVYYKDFEIKPMAIRDASKFSKKEIWEIERALNELYSLKDYKSVSRGKVKENGMEHEHMGFSLPCGFPSRILYNINSNLMKKVTIEKIYKHNEKFLQ